MARNRSWSLRPDPNRYLSPIVDMSSFSLLNSLPVCAVRANALPGGGCALYREPGGSLEKLIFLRAMQANLDVQIQDGSPPLEGCQEEVNFLSVIRLTANS
jgi:hypothetical protein